MWNNHKNDGVSIRTQRFWLKTHYISEEAPNKQVYISLRQKKIKFMSWAEPISNPLGHS